MKLSISFLIVSLSIFIYIYIIFFRFECISWYEISPSSFDDIIFHWYHDIANLIFDCLSLNLHLYINIYIAFFLLSRYLMIWNIVFFFWRYSISLISWNCQSQIWSSLSLSFHLYIYISLILLSMDLMMWNIVFFFWRYTISSISWNCQSHFWLSLSQSSFIYICHFFCIGCISSYEVSSSSYGDITFRWYHETANLR